MVAGGARWEDLYRLRDISALVEISRGVSHGECSSDCAPGSRGGLSQRARWVRSWSNGCLACGALLGGFPLYEDFVEYVSAAELELPVIATARIPLDVLYGEPEPEP